MILGEGNVKALLVHAEKEPDDAGHNSHQQEHQEHDPIHEAALRARTSSNAFIFAQVNRYRRAGKEKHTPGLRQTRAAALIARQVEAVERAEHKSQK